MGFRGWRFQIPPSRLVFLDVAEVEGAFPLGRLFATPGVIQAVVTAGDDVFPYLARHAWRLGRSRERRLEGERPSITRRDASALRLPPDGRYSRLGHHRGGPTSDTLFAA